MDALFGASTIEPKLGPKTPIDLSESATLGAPSGDVPLLFCRKGKSTQIRVIPHGFARGLLILNCTDD